MMPLFHRVVSVILEGVPVGVALGGLLVLVRRIQIAFGVKDISSPKATQITRAS
jgi:hypothetical protein